jgi:hypothetical protein
MIRVLTFFIIILIVYGFHIHYKNKESFESGSNILTLANKLTDKLDDKGQFIEDLKYWETL